MIFSRLNRALLCLFVMPLCAVVPDAGQQERHTPHFQNLRLKSEYLQRMLDNATPEQIEKAAAIEKMESMQVSYVPALAFAGVVHLLVGSFCAGMTHGTDKSWEKWFSIFIPLGAFGSIPAAVIGFAGTAVQTMLSRQNVSASKMKETKKKLMSECKGEQCQEFIDLVLRGERKGFWIAEQDDSDIYNPGKSYKTWSAKYDELHK